MQEIWTSVQVKFVVGPSSGTYMTECCHWANCPVYYVFSLLLLANIWISCHAPICEELRCRDFVPLLCDKELVVVPDPDPDVVEAVVVARCSHTPPTCSSVAVCVFYQTLTTSEDRYVICSVSRDRRWDIGTVSTVSLSVMYLLVVFEYHFTVGRWPSYCQQSRVIVKHGWVWAWSGLR